MFALKLLFKYVTALFAAYFLAWTISYVFMFLSRGDHLDFSYYFKWLVMAWTFNGLEVVTYTWIINLILVLPLWALMIFLMKRIEKRRRSAH